MPLHMLFLLLEMLFLLLQTLKSTMSQSYSLLPLGPTHIQTSIIAYAENKCNLSLLADYKLLGGRDPLHLLPSYSLWPQSLTA